MVLRRKIHSMWTHLPLLNIYLVNVGMEYAYFIRHEFAVNDNLTFSIGLSAILCLLWMATVNTCGYHRSQDGWREQFTLWGVVCYCVSTNDRHFNGSRAWCCPVTVPSLSILFLAWPWLLQIHSRSCPPNCSKDHLDLPFFAPWLPDCRPYSFPIQWIYVRNLTVVDFSCPECKP